MDHSERCFLRVTQYPMSLKKKDFLRKKGFDKLSIKKATLNDLLNEKLADIALSIIFVAKCFKYFLVSLQATLP